jgi:Sulfotransferase domain
VTLPTFLIIGAAKSGTTSLHAYLAEHPEIAMTSEKEPMCFEPAEWRERILEYDQLFTTNAPVRGESSTAYSAYPWAPQIPDRVQSVVPDAKVIYVVREPIERMLSHYAQNQWDRKRVRPFEELMADLEEPMNMPVWCSRYATQYERWAERFGTERILVLDQRDLAQRREPTLRRVFEFLEVDPSFTSPNWDARHNEAVEHRVPTRLGERLGARRATLERLLPPVASLMMRPVRKPRLSDEQRRRVVALFKPEAQRLRELTGLALEGWPV